MLKKTLLYFFLITYAVVILYPIAWVFVSSLKDNASIITNPYSFPKELKWNNFYNAWKEAKMGQALLNSLIVTGCSVIGVAFLAAMVSYPIARLTFKWRGILYALFISGLFVAPVTALIPLLKLLSRLNLVDSYWALVLPYIAFGLPLSVAIMRSFYIGLPRNLEDAAKVDGLGTWKTFWKIIFPLAKPALYTVIILQVINSWNEYLFALVFIRSPHNFTIPRAVATFSGTFQTDYGLLNAAIVISALPTIIIYLIFAERIRGAMAIRVGGKG
ncbi:carbohydrate ABC transporter permease [Kosmotoga sp. DU53]|uniref:carbohydrate ABC transporter permease n=1 Tax=Kosmotoga sp. DU53 TaxID=1310160 RepID=UPI0007C486C6|nr:carbohydrate ABC transporter permease [Kosmotoga sp. DU53]OAA21248.1 hypothetical protein DU53_06525 [Kosmotoga sp. DU53]